MFCGAAGRIRTADLILTKDALYLLSYSSICAAYAAFYSKRLAPFHTMATQNGLEPSTSSVTGWRSNQLNYWAKSLKAFALYNMRDELSSSKAKFFDKSEHILPPDGSLNVQPAL